MADRISMTLEGVPQLQERLKNWDASVRREMRSALTKIGNAWVTEAKRRVPVETGLLRNSINKSVSVTSDGFELAVGSSSKYASYVEFGTRYIAGGRVLAIGTKPEVTEAEAITDWPAKAADNAQRETMPWLRVSWSIVKPKALQLLNQAIAPPKAAA